MREELEMSYRAIANEVGSTPNAVKQSVYRARTTQPQRPCQTAACSNLIRYNGLCTTCRRHLEATGDATVTPPRKAAVHAPKAAVKAYEGIYSLQDVARHFNLSATAVRKIWREQPADPDLDLDELDPIANPSLDSDWLQIEIAHLLRCGLSAHVIARRLNCSLALVEVHTESEAA